MFKIIYLYHYIIGDTMYYLFCINDESYNLFYNNSSYLYYILKVLLHIKKEDFIYGYNLYKSICIPF